MNISILIFFYTIYLATLKVYTKLKTLAQIGAEKSVIIEIFVGEKEKWTNKRTDKQHVSDSFYTVQLDIPIRCIKFLYPR